MTAVLDHRTKSARPLNDRQTYVLRYVDAHSGEIDLGDIANRIDSIDRPNSSARDIASRTLSQLIDRQMIRVTKKGIYSSTAKGRRAL